MSVSAGLTSVWTIHIRCSRRSSTAALTSGPMPLAHNCINHSNATNVPDRPTPALKDINRGLTLTTVPCTVGTGLFHKQVIGFLKERMIGSEVTPAVYHSWPQVRNGFQMLPHMLGEGTERRRVLRNTLVWPGGVVVVGDYPVCWTVSLKHTETLCFNQTTKSSLIDYWYGQCTQESTAAV